MRSCLLSGLEANCLLASATHGAPVPWQTIYFTLLALAISSAMQPSGRVCGFPARYRVLLRCAPTVCIVDAMFPIIFAMYRFLLKGIPIRNSVLDMIAARFDEDHDRESLESKEQEPAVIPRRVKRNPVFRRLFFIFGALIPSTKLFTLYGITLSKAWGVMFVVSFALDEVYIYISNSACICPS